MKIVKENVDIISHFLYHNFNNLSSWSTFPTGMKYTDVTPIHKRMIKPTKQIIANGVLLVSLLLTLNIFHTLF